MFALLMLASMASQPGADEWRPYNANAKYEVYGHMQNGVFRYTKARLRPQPKAEPNYGLNLPKHEMVLEQDDFEVGGTDTELGRTIVEAANRATPPTASEEAPCPDGGPCPKPKPAPKPQPGPVSPGRDLVLVLAVISLLGAAGVGLIAATISGLYSVFHWVFRLASGGEE